ELQQGTLPMQQRKSRPNIERAPQLHVIPRFRTAGEHDRTLVTPMKLDQLPPPPDQFAMGTDHHGQKPPTGSVAKPAPVAAPNVIPFARPRAIAAMPATF